MSDINKLMQQLTELMETRDNISECVEFVEENASLLTKEDWGEVSLITSGWQELSTQLDKLQQFNNKLTNKWIDHELLEGLHPIEDTNPIRSELLKSNDTQKIPK